MAVHLIGGGWDEDESSWTGLFLAEAAQRCDGPPRIVVVLWAQTVSDGERWHDDYRADFTRLGPCEVAIVQLTPSRALSAADLVGAHAIFVGGGHTPSYYEAVMPARAALRAAVAEGTPYAGYSAGAMIAGSQALLGGWRLNDLAVCPQEASEGLTEVTLAEGLGLVDGVVDVHCAEMGLLGRAVALVAAGRTARAVAIDECTSAVFDPALSAAGKGQVWEILPGAADGTARIRSARSQAHSG